MGYDSTVNVYDKNNHYIGMIIDDISFRAIIDLIKFARERQVDENEVDYIRDDIMCKRDVALEFLEKYSSNKEHDTNIYVCETIASIEEIAYFGITSI